jgi:hypothetical protein
MFATFVRLPAGRQVRGTERHKRSKSTSCFFVTSQNLTNPEDELDWFFVNGGYNFFFAEYEFFVRVAIKYGKASFPDHGWAE